MANETKAEFLSELQDKYGELRRLQGSNSLYELKGTPARVYVRYSRVHGDRRTFYGLRESDLRQLEGLPSVICFLWDNQAEPLFVPYSDYEDVIRATSPAADGQYKAQVVFSDGDTELYIAQAGRFSVESNLGWDQLDTVIGGPTRAALPPLSHQQVQTLLGAIGNVKGYEVWVPITDRPNLDWSLAKPFQCRDTCPAGFDGAEVALREVDVMWLPRGAGGIEAVFEVEHTTPVYSGLLRLNDIHLAAPRAQARYCVVANDVRRGLFIRQLQRPTFQVSGLAQLCTFLDYPSVYGWYNRVAGGKGTRR